MLRRAPEWFTRGRVLDKAKEWWPWALGAGVATMYLFQPDPFNEVGRSTLSMLRRPVLRGTEWLEVNDVDPESMVLELPPDQVFGPLPLRQQMDFLLQALRADNELADMYIARLLIDHMDLSLDPPPLGNLLVECRGKELLDFAIADFSETRQPRKHTFFNADQFIRVVNMCAPHNELAEYFVKHCDGVTLLFKALRASTETYSRVLVMRSLTLFAFTQAEDGFVERELLVRNCMPGLVDAYRQGTGDATDSRFTSMLLSSVMRHYPEAATKELARLGVVQAIVDQINTARYKSLPQHYRLIEDLRRLPAGARAAAGLDVEREMSKADIVPVALGVIDAFPEYLESVNHLLNFVGDLRKRQLTTPMNLVEYRLLTVAHKLFVRYEHDKRFTETGARQKLCDLVAWACTDAEVVPHLTSGTRDMQAQFSTVRKFVPELQAAAAAHNTPAAVAGAA